MTDDAQQEPKQPKPRAKSKRKRAKRKPFNKRELSMMDKIDEAAKLLTVDERACAHLATEYSEEHAATTLGWDLVAVKEVLARPNVRRYIDRAEAAFLEKLAASKVRALKKVGVNSANVEARLMELAQMDPSETKGNIDGQVKALRTLAEIMGLLDENDPLKGKNREQLKEIIMGASTRLLPGEHRPQ